ncbi:MAG: DUF2752 domain-containing protein [Kineosporiaceae bacterium]|nr:DUF2752 domain-containing protein [Kineosporiaceae bacterium]
MSTSPRRAAVRDLPAWVAPALTAAGAAAGCLMLSVRDPREPGSYGICPWLAVTGTFCPGCGLLRAVNRLLDGDVVRALAYNALIVAAVPVLVYAWLTWALPNRVTRSWPRLERLPAPVVWAGYGLLAVFWVARNLPWWPFTALVPPHP